MNCVRCGFEIPAERLEAMPETRICVGCSREIGGEFEYRATCERTNKAGSMKVNYGDLNIEKRRKVIKPLFVPKPQ
jgi:hypothetical protein